MQTRIPWLGFASTPGRRISTMTSDHRKMHAAQPWHRDSSLQWLLRRVQVPKEDFFLGLAISTRHRRDTNTKISEQVCLQTQMIISLRLACQDLIPHQLRQRARGHLSCGLWRPNPAQAANNTRFAGGTNRIPAFIEAQHPRMMQFAAARKTSMRQSSLLPD